MLAAHENKPVEAAPALKLSVTVTIRLPEKWTRFLIGQPESGMGYQRVDVRLVHQREIKDAVLFNTEEIELPDDCTE